MALIEATKIFNFAYAHHLPSYEGPCAAMHGHTGVLEVTIENATYETEYPCMVFDFKYLKAIVEDTVIKKLDHTCLNDHFCNPNEPPTCETVIQWMSDVLNRAFPKGIILKRLKLYETPTSYITWRVNQ